MGSSTRTMRRLTTNRSHSRTTRKPEVEARAARSPERRQRNLELMGPESGNIVTGAFTPVLAKHTKSFNLVDTLSVGVDRKQRNFEPMERQGECWRET